MDSRLAEALAELEKDPAFRKSRSCAVVIYAVRFLATGVEMSVILPTIWPYVEELHGTPLFVGFTECAYAFGSVIALPVCGFIYDRTKKAKEIILVLNALQICGNLLYAAPASKWCLLFGRLLAGLGDGFTACYGGELTYIYTPKRRLGIISVIGLGRMLGIMIGPLLNFFVVKVSFHIGTWKFDVKNFAGLLTAMFWILIQVICLLAPLNLAEIVIGRSFNSTDDGTEDENDQDVHEQVHLFTNGEDRDDQGKGTFFKNYPNVIQVIIELASVEFLVLFFVDIVMMISYLMITILIPLITERDYGWKQEYTGLVYVGGAMEIMFILSMIFTFGHRYPVRDTWILALGLVFVVLSMAGLVLEDCTSLMKYRLPAFILSLVFATGFFAIGLITPKALITKTLKVEWQGVAQGTFSSITRLSSIVGPVVGGVAYYNRTIYGSILLASSCLALALLLLVKKRFHERQDNLNANT